MTCVKRSSGGFDWQIETRFAGSLDDLLASPATVVKESPAKLVTRHRHDGLEYYIKRYRHAAVPLRPLKYWVKHSEARQEWLTAQRLAALEIPAVDHLALGERWGGTGLQESILVTRGFHGKPLAAADDRLDLQAVLRFVNRLLDAGVVHPDLHPANILCDRQTGELRLVDLRGIRVGRMLTDLQRAECLAFVRMSLPIPVDRSIEKLSRVMRRQALAKRSRRCLKHNREFRPLRAGGLRWQIRAPFDGEGLRRITNDPDGFLVSGCRLLKQGRSATVGCADELVLKRHNLRKISSVFKDLLRRSRAVRAYQKAYHLELVKVATAPAVAVAERRVLRVLLRSYLVTGEIADAVPLHKWRGDCRQATRRVAMLLARLHDEGFSNRDLKSSNIVLNHAGTPYLIDLDGLQYHGDLKRRRAVADLARFSAGLRALVPSLTRSDWARFLRQYAETRCLEDWRWWWKAVAAGQR